MNEKDKEILEKKLAKQKENYEAQLANLRAENLQVCFLYCLIKYLLTTMLGFKLEHKNRELTKVLENHKNSQVCTLL
jgi:hypothetical protein